MTDIDFEINQLRYFVETARTGSMSQAAKNLSISQQALSKGIANLEDKLGAELFVRSKSGVSLTPFGRFFQARARLVLASATFAQESFRDFAAGVRRTVALGMPSECMTDFGGTLSPARLYAFQKDHPHVTYEFNELPLKDIRERLDSGSLQFGIGVPTDDRDRYDSVTLANFPLAVLVSRDNPLARAARLTPDDLAGGTVAVPAGQEGFAALLKQLEGQTGRPIHQLPIKMNPVDGAELIVDRDIFVVRPEQHARRTTSTDRVAIVPLVDGRGHPVDVALNLMWRRGRKLDAEERALVDYLVGLYANREDGGGAYAG